MQPSYIVLDQRPRWYVGPRATNAPIMAAQAAERRAQMARAVAAAGGSYVASEPLGQCCPSCPPGVPCSPKGLGATIGGNLGAIALVGIAAVIAWKVMRPKKRRNPGRKWIKGAIKHPGALTATVKRRYGSGGFTASPATGRPIIKERVLRELAREPGTTGKRARLAMTMRSF